MRVSKVESDQSGIGMLVVAESKILRSCWSRCRSHEQIGRKKMVGHECEVVIGSLKWLLGPPLPHLYLGTSYTYPL